MNRSLLAHPQRSVVLIVAAAVVAACSASTADTTTTIPPTTTTPSSATTSSTSTTSTTTASTTTTTVSASVGDPAAYQLLVDQTVNEIGENWLPEGVGFPDLLNPNPVAALESMLTFSEAAARGGYNQPALVAFWTEPDGPARDLFRAATTTFFTRGYRIDETGETWTWHGGTVVDLDSVGLTDSEIAAVPDGSVAIEFATSSGAYRVVDPNGTVVAEEPGWPASEQRVAIVTPSDVGWRAWFYRAGN